MKNNITHSRRLKAGRPKTAGLNTTRRSFSPGIATNYKKMLELYCINKEEASAKKDLKYQRLNVRKSVRPAAKPSFSIAAAIISFFEESLLLLKKLKPRMAMAPVSE